MKVSPETIILTVALVLLTAVAAGLALTFPTVQDITGVPSTTPTGNTPPKLKQEDLNAQLAPWNAPAVWPETDHRIFKSEEFLFYPDQFPDGTYIRKVDPSVRSPSGVLISWYQKYGLDFTNPDVDRQDPDNDGFSNLVEFQNEQAKATDADGTKSTDPLNPQSHPSYLSRLRLQKYDSRPFHIQFRGIQTLNGTTYFQIFLKDEPGSSQPGLKKTGDKLGFESYVIGPYHQNIVSQEDPATHLSTQVDMSTLELDKPDIGFKIILTFRQETDSPESTADLVMLMPTERNNVIKVARGKTFMPPFMEVTTFVLIDVDATGATIRNQETKEDLKVPLLDPKEWDYVPQPGSGKPAAGGPSQ